ncbi:MAG: cadherin domain-containing protein, partial [Candidatus Thiodiazotropha sp.]
EDNVYELTVEVTDASGGTATQNITITVTDVAVGDPSTGNQVPVIGSGNSFNIDENLTDVGSVVASDPDGHGVLYSISGGVDAALFQIDNATGALSFLVAPDYENPTDLGDTAGNNTYVVEVTVSDNYSTPLTATQTITVTVNDTNVGAGPIGNTEPNNDPQITSDGGNDTAAVSVAENSTAVTTVTAADPDADNAILTYSLSGGADQGRFIIDGATGALSFLVAPNFEAPADADGDNVYEIEVTVTDDHGGTDIQTISVTVTDVTVGDPNTGNQAPVISSGNSFNIDENLTDVGSVVASDPDGHGMLYSISGGADAALFQIDDTTGALSFLVAPDYENPTDLGDTAGNNTYVVEVTVSDNYSTPLTATQTITVTVNDINVGAGPVGNTEPNNDPQITSDGGGDTATITVAEHTTVVTTVTATDPDTDNTALTYSIIGGVDAQRFAIDANTGLLSFLVGPDYEAPADANDDNSYQVQVSVADDNGGTDIQALTINVTDVVVGDPSTENDAPVFTSSANVSVQENNLTATTVTAADPDGHALSYSIVGGADAESFTIDPDTGVLNFHVAPNFEAPADSNLDGIYTLTVQVDDAHGGVTTQNLTITITNDLTGADPSTTNQAPVFTSAADRVIQENSASVGAVTASDPDGQRITYSIAGGVDAGSFTIDPTTGVLDFITTPNFEAPHDADADNVYELMVTATDAGGASATQNMLITVSDVNEFVNQPPAATGEAPVFTSEAIRVVQENSVGLGAVTASDPDGDQITYTITGGADAASFSINPITGALQFIAAPDFENPHDVDANNVYELIVSATDERGDQSSQSLLITVTNVDESTNQEPVVTSVDSFLVPENTSTVGGISASDPDGEQISFHITGGADAASFTIDSATGVLTFNTTPNFEAPHDADGNNRYELNVTVTDASGGLVTQNLTITVSDVDESTDNQPPQPPTNNNPPLQPDGPNDNTPGSDGNDRSGDSFNNETGANEGLPGQDFEGEDGGSFLLGDYTTEGNQGFRTLVGETATDSLSPFGLLDFDFFGRGRSDIDELYTKPGEQAFRILVTEAEQPSLFVFHGMRDLVIETDAKSFHAEVPVDAFTHTDRNANVFLYASLSNGQPLPEWIGFDPVKGVFVGVIPDGVDVDVEITVTAVDGEGRTASFTFSIKSAELQQKSGFTQQLRMHSAVVTRG